MKNTIRVNANKGLLVMDRTFAKNSQNIRSEEYDLLQRARRDYPYYPVVIRRIKRNSQKETYAGLTYAYMENYILTHESDGTVDKVIAEYKELRLISECHKKSRRYPVIKKWFLEKYPSIEEFGMEKKNDAFHATEDSDEFETIIPALNNAA